MKDLVVKAVSVVAAIALAGCAVYVQDRPGLRMGQRRDVVAVGGPRLVLVTGTSIKYCPDEDEDLFFYGGGWYVLRGGVWYRGARHAGPWTAVRGGVLPASFAHIPPGHFKHGKAKVSYPTNRGLPPNR